MDKSLKKIDRYYFNSEVTIGKGAFGKVYLGFDLTNHKAKVAVKVIPLLKLAEDPKVKDMILREIDILKQLKSDYIVRFLDARRSDNNLYIFMEYCDGGNLQEKIDEDPAMTEEEICLIIKQIAHAFLDIDQLDILDKDNKRLFVMHRDIKLSNILLHQGKIKLADFGFAKTIEDFNKSMRLKHSLLGTAAYMSPQILNNENYSAKCDIWSTGVLFYRLLYGMRPWKGESDEELYKNIKNQPLDFPVSSTPEIEDLLKKMLEIDEKKRISWWEVYSHPALQPYKI